MTSTRAVERGGGALVEHLPLVTYTLRLEPPYDAVYISPQLKPLFGYSPQEAFAEATFWCDRVHDDDRARFLGALAELRRTHAPMSVEYRVAHGDGGEVWVRDVAVVARETDGSAYAHGYLTEITHEKELERQLARERAQTDAFFRDSTLGLAISDSEGRYVRVNEALARINGRPAAEHVGATLADLAPEIAARVADVYASVLETGAAVHQHELTIPAADGERTVLLSAFPIELDGERHLGRAVVDITEQRRAERERRVAEQQYRSLIEQLPLVTYVNAVRPARRATFCSPQIEELTGYPPQTFLDDQTLGDRLVHPDDLARVERAEAAAARDEVVELEYRIVRADGSIRWVLDLMHTVCDDDGEALYEQGFLVDITERHDSESLFRAVFEGAFEAIVIIDSGGRYVDVNPAACELLGRTRDEILALSVGDVSASPAELEAVLTRLFETGELAGRHSIVRPDGEQRDVEFAAKAHVLPGRHLSVMRDVTERGALERELWRTQNLESIGRLAGGVAHDFNNMLTAIRGHAQLLAARTQPGSPEQRHASEIERASTRAADLTAQLLAFGRRQTLQPRTIDLNRLLDGLRGMLGHVVESGAALELDPQPGVCAVRADEAQVEQVLLNLVANADDATGPGGHIVVRTRNAEVGADHETGLPPGRYAVVTVEDDGRGIDGETLEHLFEPFFTTKPVGAGTGLALATAYGIVKQSGGTIVVASRPGEGSTFSVYLPEAAGPVRETLLVVEADAGVRDVVFEILSEAGHRVLTARTAADAVRISAELEGRIDLVVADLAQPWAHELVAALHDARPGLRTLSLPKPYTPEQLREEVALALALT